jgi:CDP-glucose 4,6-dehydratase
MANMKNQTQAPPSSSIELFPGIFAGKTVLVTGHTGFKGSWLSEWLLMLGARVAGFSLPPPTSPALFKQLRLAGRIAEHRVGDIRNRELVRAIVSESKPDFIFHLAAQPIVRQSYKEPVETYETNVMGTVHLLDAVRAAGKKCVVVCITTDKCYENKEWLQGYREEDSLGGYDPYSSSKAAAEIAIAAYRRSFFNPDKFISPETFVALASARAGNVIGGGDWAADRIVPDCIRALDSGEAIRVRNSKATRPWQHVLEPLSGYLSLAAQLHSLVNAPATQAPDISKICSAFNFGPNLDSNRSVGKLVAEILKHRPGSWVDESNPHAPHEAGLLNLATDKAFHLLGWQPVWNFEKTVRETIEWYVKAGKTDVLEFTRNQILDYTKDSRKNSRA